MRITQIKPLDESYVCDPNSGCWLWTENTDKDGYGLVSIVNDRGLKSKARAHRVMHEREYGPAPEGAKFLHHCDTPGCVRPDHVFPGTPRDNHDDMVRKGRRVDPMLGRKQSDRARLAVSESNRRRAQPVDPETGQFLRKRG